MVRSRYALIAMVGLAACDGAAGSAGQNGAMGTKGDRGDQGSGGPSGPAGPAGIGFRASYDVEEGTGTTTVDGSGNGHVLTLSASGVSWTPLGHTGNALLFDGVSGYVSAADTEALNPAEEITLQAWVYQTGNATTNNAVLSKDGSYGLSVNNGQVQMGLSTVGVPAFTYTGSGAVPLDTWTQLMATYDGLAIRTFVNGEMTSWAAAPNRRITASTNDLQLGLRQGDTEGFAGRIDEVRVLGLARSQESRVIRRWQGTAADDGTDNGALGGRTVTYPKRMAGSGLRVMWSDNFRVFNPNTACTWEVLFNGAVCTNPGSLRFTKYNQDGPNRPDPNTVMGTCFGLPAGNIIVTTRVQQFPVYPGGDCYTGFQSLVSLEVEEVQ